MDATGEDPYNGTADSEAGIIANATIDLDSCLICSSFFSRVTEREGILKIEPFSKFFSDFYLKAED